MDWVAHDRGKVDGHDQVWNRIFHIINADCNHVFPPFRIANHLPANVCLGLASLEMQPLLKCACDEQQYW